MFEHRSLLCSNIGKKVVKPRFYWSGTMLRVEFYSPHWHHRHYPALSRIIAQIASQQGLDYQLLTLADLLRLQQQFLRQMGEKPKA